MTSQDAEEIMAEQGYKILKKTDIISIRIDPELNSKLHERSEEQKISLNTLINHLLEKQISWNELTDELGWIISFRSTFREIMDSISKEKIIKIATNFGTTDLKNAINYFYGKISLDFILDLFKKKFHSMNVHFREISENGNKKIIIQHDLGENWPYLIVTEMNGVLNEIGYRIINDEYNRNGFSFEIVSIEVVL